MNDYRTDINRIIQSLLGVGVYRIILIGSYAAGSFRADSDLDIVVILDDETICRSYQEKMANKLRVRRAIYEVSERIPIDLIVYTKGEYERINELNTSFSHEIQTTGKILYEKAG